MTDFEDSIRDRMEPFNTESTRRLSPKDDQAVYGYPSLGGREAPVDVPLYKDAGALVDAIRTVEPGDMVRINDGQFYPVIDPEMGPTGEGFVYETPQGVRREVFPYNTANRPRGTFDSSWVRRYPSMDSEGAVEVLEVKWK